jgi:hypothetical protein
MQPSPQRMMRIWQAYVSVRDTQSPRPVQRRLTVSRPVVQIRLSVLITTVGAFIVAAGVAILFHLVEPRDHLGRHIRLPDSQLDWIVHTVHEHNNGGDHSMSSQDFFTAHCDLKYIVSFSAEGHISTSIRSPTVSEKNNSSTGSRSSADSQ